MLVRQVLGAIAQFEKASLVAKLKAARDRKRAAAGKCEGRKSWAEINPELVREAKRLRRRSRGGINARCVMLLLSLPSLASSISAARSSLHRQCSLCSPHSCCRTQLGFTHIRQRSGWHHYEIDFRQVQIDPLT